MKNRKRIISVLAVLTLMVSTMILFTGCNQIYKKKLIGVWEVKKITDTNGNDISLTEMEPDNLVNPKMYVYFTKDGKYGIAAKISTVLFAGILKIMEADYEFNNPKLTIKIENESFTGDCILSGKKLTFKAKTDKEEATIEAEKVLSPSLDDCKNAQPISSFLTP